MTIPSQVQQLEELGVDMSGFIFYKGSKRYMGDKITASEFRKIGGNIVKIGVFVNEDYETIMHIIDNYRLDMVQLHGDETPVFCSKVANYINVIKAFRISENDPMDWMMNSYSEHCDIFMFDTLGAGYGGTGKKFDWNMLKRSAITKPYFLSGGIEPGDEPRLLEFLNEDVAENVFAIDLNSKFETAPGVKDIEKLSTFIANIR